MPAHGIGLSDDFDLQVFRFMAHPTKPSITVCYVSFQQLFQLLA